MSQEENVVAPLPLSQPPLEANKLADYLFQLYTHEATHRFLLDYKKSKFIYEAVLPIMKVNRIKCRVKLFVSLTYLTLRIDTRSTFKFADPFPEEECSHIFLFEKHYAIDANDVQESLKTSIADMFRTLQKLVFNKELGEFVEGEEFADMFAFLRNLNNMEMDNMGSCCICHESTDNLTACLHHICIPCFAAVPKPRNSFDLQCPLCRAKMGEYQSF